MTNLKFKNKNNQLTVMFKKILLVAALLIPMLASAQTLKIGLVDQSEILGKMRHSCSTETDRGGSEKV